MASKPNFVRAICDYVAQREDELSLRANDIIEVKKVYEDSWWEGLKDGFRGFFPSTYTEPYDPNAPKKVEATPPVKTDDPWTMNFDQLPVEKPPVSEPKSAPKVVEQAKPVLPPQPVQAKQPVQSEDESSSSDDEDDEEDYSDDDEDSGDDNESEDSYGADFEAESIKKVPIKKDAKPTMNNKFAVRKTKNGASGIKRAKSPMAPHKWATKLLESPAQSAATEPIYGDAKRVDQAYMTSDALRRYRDELVSKERLVGELRKEIQTLRIMEKRQSKAIKELEQEKGNLPRVVQTITEENRVIKEKLREFQSKYSTDEKILAEQHEEIVRLKQNVKEQQQVMKTKKLDSTSVGKKAKEELDEKDKKIADLQHKVGILERSKEQEQKKFQMQVKEANGETEKLKQTIEKLKTIAKQHNLGHLIKHIDDSSPVKGVLKNGKENASPTKIPNTKAKTTKSPARAAIPDTKPKSKIPVRRQAETKPLRRLDQTATKKVNISDESDNESIHESSEDEESEEETSAEESEKEEEEGETFVNSARGKPIVKMEAPALVPVQPSNNQTLEALISPRQQPPYPKRSDSPEIRKPATAEGVNISVELEQESKNKRDLANPFTKVAEPITTRSSVAATTERLYRASTANANLHLHNHEIHSTNIPANVTQPPAVQDPPPRNDIFKPNFGIAKKDRWKSKPF